MESLMKINDPILLALIATGFTWFMTALGAAMVFFFKEINKKGFKYDAGLCCRYLWLPLLFWSLLAPAIEIGGKKAVCLPGLLLLLVF